MRPTLATKDPYGVALVGEALGEKEAEEGEPFKGPAGHRLTRLIEWAGLERSRFDIWNVVWCRPPGNALEGQAYETGAISHCKQAHWEALLDRPRVVVPMGNVPLHAFTGRKGILRVRGYIQGGQGFHIVPTVHPSFIQRGQAKYSAAFINDIQKAVQVAQQGLVVEPTNYLLDPPPYRALEWARAYCHVLESGRDPRLAFDIETPGKGEDEGDLEEDQTFHIFRIGFSYQGHGALSIPWSAEYIPAIKLLLEGPGEKIVWNAGFDVPRVRAAGVSIGGTIHDGMVAWHILHSDLPKGLGFVATFTCPFQPGWKHLSHTAPAFYNATDADVEWRSVERIFDDLRRTGLWDVYQRDVLDLEPILTHMHLRGMPIAWKARANSAVLLQVEQQRTLSQLEELVPPEARRIDHVYKLEPKDKTGLLIRPSTRIVPCCPGCGVEKPKKNHFQPFKRKSNPCAGLRAEGRERAVDEYYRLAPFKPSRDQLIRYQRALGRPVPTKYDKKERKRKPTMDEKAIQGLRGKFPNDKLYPTVLHYRTLDKIAGTYIGRVASTD